MGAAHQVRKRCDGLPAKHLAQPRVWRVARVRRRFGTADSRRDQSVVDVHADTGPAGSAISCRRTRSRCELVIEAAVRPAPPQREWAQSERTQRVRPRLAFTRSEGPRSDGGGSTARVVLHSEGALQFVQAMPPSRPFPRRTLEVALRVPRALKDKNGAMRGRPSRLLRRSA